MQVTYINHSCFLVETHNKALLFDYFQGELPFAGDKPLYCFASHSHGDHFSEKLFEVTAGYPDTRYILSDDIFKSRVPSHLINRTDFVSPGQTMLIDSISLKTLKSTDVGVAFILEDEGRLIYHAGDLNDWIWEGESDEYNCNMEQSYIREIEKLKGLNFHLAFLPLDSRQTEENREKGIRLFLHYAGGDNIFPMHMWDRYDIGEQLAFKLGPEIGAGFRCPAYKGEKFIILEE